MIDVNIAISKVNKSLSADGVGEVDCCLVSTMIAELGTNIIKYAKQGSIEVKKHTAGQLMDLQITAKDEGPGIQDIHLAMKDSFTTGGSLGLGLPALKRMADEFIIKSENDMGTYVYVRKKIKLLHKKNSKKTVLSPANLLQRDKSTVSEYQQKNAWDIGYYVRPMSGHMVSGDAVCVIEFDHHILLAVIDVTGHGDIAHEVANKIQLFIQQQKNLDLVWLMKELHEHLKGSVGAALGLFLVDVNEQSFEYISIGNTKARRSVGDTWRGVTKEGVLGQRLPNLIAQQGHLNNGDVFVLWSDGLSDHLIDNFIKNIAYESSDKIAFDLIRSLGKRYDDVSCIVFKWLL